MARIYVPDSLNVHGLRLTQPVPGRRGRRPGRSLSALRLALCGVVHMHPGLVLVVVVWRVHVTVAQEQRGVILGRVHVLDGRVHVIHQLLQVHVII